MATDPRSLYKAADPTGEAARAQRLAEQYGFPYVDLEHFQVDRHFGEQIVIDRRIAIVWQEIDIGQTITAGQLLCGAHFRRLVVFRHQRKLMLVRQHLSFSRFFSQLFLSCL